MDKEAFLRYAAETYGAAPEYPWIDLPDAFVLRHAANQKWFAVGLTVRRDRLGLPGDGTVDVVNVKCDPMMSGSYLSQPGILPAYHMNKLHWLSVLLNGTAADDDVRALLDMSFALTYPKKKGKPNP
jgi:predicted DNA-binding protein (MmcQ/YjbR family)